MDKKNLVAFFVLLLSLPYAAYAQDAAEEQVPKSSEETQVAAEEQAPKGSEETQVAAEEQVPKGSEETQIAAEEQVPKGSEETNEAAQTEAKSEYSSLTDGQLNFELARLQTKKRTASSWVGIGLGFALGSVPLLILGALEQTNVNLGLGSERIAALWIYSGIWFLVTGAAITAISLPILAVRSAKIKAMEQEKRRRFGLATNYRPAKLTLLLAPTFVGFQLSLGHTL